LDFKQAHLNLFIKRIKKTYPDAKVLLFGSRARNTAKKSSDIDLIIITPAFEKIQYVRRASHILPLYPGYHHVDVLCYTPNEFLEKSKMRGVVQQAKAEGIYL
jgi:predicted nucleotidyltransferase